VVSHHTYTPPISRLVLHIAYCKLGKIKLLCLR